MLKWIVTLATVTFASCTLLFTPMNLLVQSRRELAWLTIQYDLASLGVLLFEPLVELGDPIAENNFGALLYRGIGIEKDTVRASELLFAAASSGYSRAGLNVALGLLRTCSKQGYADLDVVSELRQLSEKGDIRAASFELECYDPTSSAFPSKSELVASEGFDRMMHAIEISTSTGDADEHLKAGLRLLDAAEREIHSQPAGSELIENLVPAALHNFGKAIAGRRNRGYAGYAALVGKFADYLGNGEFASTVRSLSRSEWLVRAFRGGDVRSACMLALEYSDMFYTMDGIPTREELVLFGEVSLACNRALDPSCSTLRDVPDGRLFFERETVSATEQKWKEDEGFLIYPPEYLNEPCAVSRDRDAAKHKMKRLYELRPDVMKAFKSRNSTS